MNFTKHSKEENIRLDSFRINKHQKIVMDAIGLYEYSSKDLIGHGAFAVVYKGRVRMVRNFRYILLDNVENLEFGAAPSV